MENPSSFAILIVGETPDVAGLRQHLIESGATVHVVSVAGASLMLRRKQIDSAFIAASLDANTQHLCAELDTLGIARVFLPAWPQSTFADNNQPTNVPQLSAAAA